MMTGRDFLWVALLVGVFSLCLGVVQPPPLVGGVLSGVWAWFSLWLVWQVRWGRHR